MRLIISGGGTGGHIYPALALIKELKKQEPDSEVLYVGSTRGIEKNIVPKLGIKFKELRIQGFKRSLSLDNFKTVYLFLKSVHESKKIIKQFHPDIVIGTGGYVSGAVVYAASRLHIPTLIHEQNSVVGLTNRFLSHYVNKIAIAFHMAADQFPSGKVVFTGNPRAQQVANLKSNFKWSQYDLKDDVPTALIVGGSQGALKLNQSTVEAIKKFNQRKYQLVFVTGPKRYDDVKRKLSGIDINSNVVIKPYISNMPLILPKTDVIIGRAGATSLAEITAIGIPSILIPSPYVTADHQTKNAMSLVKNNAAIIVKESDLNADSLIKPIDELMANSNERHQMATNSRKMGVQDAATRLYHVMKQLTGK
ncbi:UDP-N-acetylglucosamine--N-acetylmuramyl-(pentapeptide) pyrophosphoryl-undecaprenol N-acetylglucosamine transferase [Philodulcilactobacillus myokoensis]|uniref:UDP-N-acetylglucosamine--N-acetylmuramyl-(pentapeptide) pyrophosphoryl-undecaprenol N-acetylglucosamine transferase n=1 Tax=Philodulcilactobacillus myokoensis TaxID=2929573 RepID=A0A9W6B252_9LACO|nr:undecaprenyldiphospho-muramoylpentapeptide beta-N-acetylglucosaminyltransferase [Philodulcilactobacillus myokoensis]GLB47023.1 UDP-N-acetylglucosamine--N-acetylmuramyl-(pentapeptide) pyrophosphoryl-undecaprenol N-acetylglucosamine transferase [Philodulcilactobacillus myokoensis]